MINPFIGKTIDKYEIVEYLGRGATADVYKAYQPTLERYVAIKVLHSFLSDDAEYLTRFQTEAKAAARLRHPNIVQVYDFNIINGTPYLVMEYIEGVTLKSRLDEYEANKKFIDLVEAIRIARDVAMGLAYAHERGLVHRDIKPANVMLTRDNQVIIADFGTAKILGGVRNTATGITVGTAAYASPEQVMALPSDARSDLYSLGVVFFEMVTGQIPFQGDTGVAVFLKHLTDPVPNVLVLNPALPVEVENFIFKAMAKKAEERFQDANAFVSALERIPTNHSVHDTPKSQELSSFDPGPFTALPDDIQLPTSPFKLTPYTLSAGYVVEDPADLPRVCFAQWDRAVNHFAKGYIARWLREGVEHLRAEHLHGPADDLEVIASRAEALAHDLAESNEVRRNAALAEFLLSLGAPRPVMEIKPNRIVLPSVGVGMVGKPVFLIVINKGPGYLYGKATSQVPWLRVTTERFGCADGESWVLQISPSLVELEAGLLQQDKAILISGFGGDVTIGAQIELLPPILQVDVTTFNLGRAGQGETITKTIHLRNRGQGYLIGEFQGSNDWITASQKHFRIAPGEEQEVIVEIDTQSLPIGDLARRDALVIASNGGREEISVTLRVYPPRLYLEPARVDFGVADLSQSQVQKNVTLNISNVGVGVLRGTIKPAENWLTLEPATFRCEPDQTQPIEVSVANLKTGEYLQEVQIVSNGGNAILPIRVRVFFSLEPETVCIPAGKFLRGSRPRTKEGDTTLTQDLAKMLFAESKPRPKEVPGAEQPQRPIFMSEYWIGKYPVTNEEYAVFIRATNRRPPEHWTGNAPPPGFEKHPVVNVTWHQALAYCLWLSEVTGKTYRLPSEAQWEKAARGTESLIFPWGNKWDEHRCNSLESGIRRTTAVGTYSLGGDSMYGCTDMAGNVWEWTFDWYAQDYYTQSTISENPLGPANGVFKVIRGGSYMADADHVRAANRQYANVQLTSPEIGFRVAIKVEG